MVSKFISRFRKSNDVVDVEALTAEIEELNRLLELEINRNAHLKSQLLEEAAVARGLRTELEKTSKKLREQSEADILYLALREVGIIPTKAAMANSDISRALATQQSLMSQAQAAQQSIGNPYYGLGVFSGYQFK